MRTVLVRTTSVVLALACAGSAWAFGHANRWGGSTWHSFGATSHTSAFGTRTTHVAGVGTAHTTPYGATAYRRSDRYYGYHPPTTVGYYGAHCYDCGGGGWAAAAGVAGGAAIGAGTAAVANTTLGTAGAFNAAVAPGASVAAGTSAVGQVVAALPAGCVTPEVQGRSYYLCGNTWFAVAYGANGVYYKVVPTP